MPKGLDNTDVHGTDCAMSSAVACGHAFCSTLAESFEQAKSFVSGALRAGLNQGERL